MKISVTHKSTGYTVIHENVARISESNSRFELIDCRQRKGPLCSTTRGAVRMPDALDRRHLSKNPNVWEFAANKNAPSQAETCKGALLRSRSPLSGPQVGEGGEDVNLYYRGLPTPPGGR